MSLEWLKFWKKKVPEVVDSSSQEPERQSFFDENGPVLFSTHRNNVLPGGHSSAPIALPGPEAFTQIPTKKGEGETLTVDEAIQSYGMDSTQLKSAFSLNQGIIPDAVFNWYMTQSFIGYQACAIISQHWLINKTLTIPAKDAVRNGFEIATDDGEELDLKYMSALREADKEYKLEENLIEFETNKRRFGFRFILFVVESDDPEYYRKPFNIDGITKDSYKGMTQVDPSWVAPILDEQSVANPAAMDFYEPTWWTISGQLYHKSHLVLCRYVNPPDILKPTYQYGGIPLTQLIYERVYAAERVANEAPMLTETKRLNVVKVDIAAVTAQPGGFQARLDQLIQFRNNYGVYVQGLDDELTQIDTSLADLDDVIMSQYQLVAAVSEIPATKLLGTSPKGFNATGEHELKTYIGLLEGIQTDLSLVVDRHHELVIKSEIAPETPFKVVTVWNPADSPSAKEAAEIGLMKSQTDQTLMASGAIDGNDVRNRIIEDAGSGYTGIDEYSEEDLEDDDDELEGLEKLAALEKGNEEPDTGADAGMLGYVSITPSGAIAAEFCRWIMDAGIEDAIPYDDVHVTLAYSEEGIPEYVSDREEYELEFTGEIGLLGPDDKPALVMFVESPKLRERFKVLEAMGARSTYDEFKPHITIKYDPLRDDPGKARKAFKDTPLTTMIMSNESRQITHG